MQPHNDSRHRLHASAHALNICRALLLKMEEDWIEGVCKNVAKFKPDVVITEKGLSDLATHFLTKAGISAIRRLRKTDNNRIARACGATIVHRPEEIRESDIGTRAGLFEVKKIGDEFYTFIIDCEVSPYIIDKIRDDLWHQQNTNHSSVICWSQAPKACSIIVRGASKDVLNEVERNLHDAMGVARNVVRDPRLVPGGGACEMAVSRALRDRSAAIEGAPYICTNG